MKRILLSILVMTAVTTSALFAQGVTTSSMSGIVTDGTDAAIGANVTAVHNPTGTFYGTSTDVDGSFNIPNMRVGGPYTVKVTYTGFAESVYEGISLQLAKDKRINVTLQEEAINLEGVEVVAKSGGTGKNAGTSTQISGEMIENLPTVNRDLNDFIRMTPQTSTLNGGISFAGVNNRFNAVYIDGAVNNDVFGLAGSGTNGGQTGISPVSVDVIDQIQTVLSPYDVTLGGFAGGGINAVTKSGTNKLSGTAYYFFQNENLTGKTNQELVDRGAEDRKLDEFNVRQYGASLGGAIVKNKVFFFTNVEIQDDAVPVPFNASEYIGDTDVAGLTSLRQTLNSRYGYDAGAFGDKQDKLQGVKFFGKINWNINNVHKLTLRHQYTKGEATNVNGSSNSRINFENNGVYFPSITNSSAIELNSMFNNQWSNNLIVAYTDVNDDRDPIGSPFPYVSIRDGNGSIAFGSEQFSTANSLRQRIFTLTNNLKHFAGKHTFTFGTHNEFYDIRNVFIRQNFGSYQYNSVDDFLAGGAPARYDRTYSLLDNTIGDDTEAAAEFTAMQIGLYAQDEWAVSNRFNLTYGLRIDIPIMGSNPNIHPTFNSETLPNIRQFYPEANDVTGGQAPKAQLMFSPRVGFDYNLSGDGKTILRGGLGIFTSRVPFVWPGAMFNNNGVTTGGFTDRNGNIATEFRPDINNQFVDNSFSVPQGQVDLFVEDFKYPQVFRTSLAVDHDFGKGFTGTVEGVYTKTLNNVIYKNINSNPTPEGRLTGLGDDTRQFFVGENIDSRYSSGIYLADNTSDGFTYNLTASINKSFSNGFNAYVAYSYNDAEAVSEGTSSQNSSQWRGQINTLGRNTPVLGRSDFAVGHRIIGALTYNKNWNNSERFATNISLVYEGQSGGVYSYVMGRGVNVDGVDGRNLLNEEGSTSRSRSLVYVPRDASEIQLVASDDMSAEQQWALLNAFIESDDHLSEQRGQFAEKNGARAPWNARWDLAIRQNVGTLIGEHAHRLQLSLDIQNFANLLSSSWGARFNTPGDNVYELYQFAGFAADGTTPTFTFTDERTDDLRFNMRDVDSRWTMRVGLRYIF